MIFSLFVKDYLITIFSRKVLLKFHCLDFRSSMQTKGVEELIPDMLSSKNSYTFKNRKLIHQKIELIKFIDNKSYLCE